MPVVACDAEPPAPGVVVVETIACDEHEVQGGEGAKADLRLANAVARVVLRHPNDALTVRAGGATVLDAAPWEGSDRLHELVPLVGGGWLEVDDVITGSGRVEVTGTVVPILPDRPAPAAGERRTVRYVLRPDDPWLYIEGAEALYVHPRGNGEVFDRALVTGSTLYGWDDGVTVEDLGGAFVLNGATRLLISDPVEGWTALAGDDGQRLQGVAEGAVSLLLLSQGRAVGRAGVDEEGQFDLRVPVEVDSVRAEAGGRAPSPATPVGAGLELALGGSGSVSLRSIWPERSRPLDIVWKADDGRGARLLAPTGGGRMNLGAGGHTLTFSAGAAHVPQTLHLDLGDGDELNLDIELPPRFDPGAWVQVGFGRPSDRARDFRTSDLKAGEAAVGDGLVWAVFAAEDDVPGVQRDDGWPALLFHSGVRLTGPGWSVLSWPWKQKAREALHGGVQQGGLGPADAAAALWGGFDDDRRLLVDLGWLQQVGAPHDVSPRPDFVELRGPDSLEPWLEWLDAGRAVVPVGPVTWVPVHDPAVVGLADVEQPLIKGNVVAGSGPVLVLAVDGLPPGEIVPPAATGDTGATDGLHTVRIEVLGGQGLDRVRLIGEGGAVLEELGPRGGTVERALDTRYVFALAEGGGAWAVTGPVWLSP